MAEKLFKDFAPSHGIPMQKDSAEGAKKLDKYAENGYESCALSQREEQDAFSFWWPLVKDCGIRVPETVIIKVPEELDEEGQKTFYRHFYMERPEDYPAIKKMQEKFEKYRGEVESLVAEHMKDVQGLSGPWSIDIMLNEGFSTEHFEKPNEFWLIDMAVAERSAYWEKRPSKLALETVPEKED